MKRERDHGAMVNRIYSHGVRVRQVMPDHELGGFVVWADLDDDPPFVHFLPIVGWALAEERDAGDRVSTLLTVTYSTDGEFEFWDLGAPPVEGLLGVSQNTDDSTREVFVTLASRRLAKLRGRNTEAEATAAASFGGPVS